MPCALLFMGWHSFVYLQQGFFVVDPAKNIYYQPVNPVWLMKNMVFILWKILDFGRVFIFIAIVLIFYFKRKQMMKEENLKLLLALSIAVFLLSILIFLPFRFPVGQRYFIQLTALGIMLFLYVIQTIPKRWKPALLTFCLLALLSGHWWIYPEKYGNGWDASLKSLPFFRLHNQLINDLEKYNIDSRKIAAEFPLFLSTRYTHLDKRNIQFTDLNHADPQGFTYILDSNISNAFRLDTRAQLRKNWILLKEYRSGQVYLKLYKNPEAETP